MCDFNCKDCQSFFCSTKPNFKTETTKQIGKEIFVWALKDPAFWCLLEIWRNTHDRNYGDKYISRNFEETRLKLNPMTISTLKKMSHLNFFIFILKKESNWEGEWTLLYVATFLRALKEYFSMTLYLLLPPPIEMVEIEKKNYQWSSSLFEFVLYRNGCFDLLLSFFSKLSPELFCFVLVKLNLLEL